MACIKKKDNYVRREVFDNFKFEIVKSKKDTIMKILAKSKILFVIAVTGLLFSCKDKKQDGYSDEIETLEYPADSADSATTVSDTTDISGFSTTNTTPKGSSGTDEGGTGTGTGPGESPKDGATYSGRTEKSKKDFNTKKKDSAGVKSTK